MGRMGFTREEAALTIEQRFWSRVDRAGQHDCWPWLRGTNTLGYGNFWVRAGELESFGGKIQLAHRVAYRLAHGKWPSPCALHGCDNPSCCNPYSPLHVHEGSKALNVQEMFLRNRQPFHLRRGPGHVSARFTVDEVRHIREWHAQGGTSFTEIALAYGVSGNCISEIVKGKRYADV